MKELTKIKELNIFLFIIDKIIAISIFANGPDKAIFDVSYSVSCVYFLPILYAGTIFVTNDNDAENKICPVENIAINAGKIIPVGTCFLNLAFLVNQYLFVNHKL